MATDSAYMIYLREQLWNLEGLSIRPMMGEYLLYCRNRLFGLACDDRLLVKPVPAALSMLPDAPREVPYPGAKEMLLVENTDDADFLVRLVNAMVPELPEPKLRKLKATKQPRKGDSPW